MGVAAWAYHSKRSRFMGSGASTGAAGAVGPSVDDVGKWSEQEVGQQVAHMEKF